MKRKIKQRTRKLSFPCAIAVTTVGLMGQAMAQEAATAQNDGIDEIVVTAQKRKESINEVPMSISAISGDQLADKGIDDVADLQKVVSGFRYTESYTGTPVFFIRGVGFNEDSLGSLPNVAVYVDEVPVTFPVMTSGIPFDLERVEVLKGPQGTLFGQSSTGGAVNYIAAKPTNTFKSAVTLGYGSFNEKTVDGFVSGPVTETLNARLAFKSVNSDGYQRSQTTGAKLGDKDILNGRLLLDWKATDKLKIGLNLTHTQDKSDLRGTQYAGFFPINGGNTALTNFAAISPAVYNAVTGHSTSFDSNRDVDWGPDRPRQDNELNQMSVRADYDLGGDKQLTYIAAHAKYKMNRLSDSDGLSVKNFQITTLGDIKSDSHELRLAGSALDNKGKWLVGGNYENSTVDQLNKLDFNVSNSYAFHAFGDFFTTDNQTNQEFTNKSIFGAFDYNFSDQLIGHLSARHSKTSDKFTGCTKDSGANDLASVYNNLLGVFGNPATIAPGGCITQLTGTNFSNYTFGTVNQELKESNTSWRMGLDWKPDAQNLYYVNVSKGYKGGSFPNLSASAVAALAPVVQESVLAYEIGLKKSLKEYKLQLNGAAFYYDYRNKQIRGRTADPLWNSLERLINIPESSVAGLELQAIWKPMRGLTASVNGTYLKTKIIKNNTIINDFNVSGTFEDEPFPNTPKFMGNADLEYAWGIDGGYTLFVGGNLAYQGKTHNGFGQDPRLKIDAYTTVDLRAGIDSPDGKWRAALWGRNMTDKLYWVNQTRVADTYVKIPGSPRAVGATFTYRFY